MKELSLLDPALSLVGNAHKRTEGGSDYIVVEAVILQEGVLPGSQGPLFYSHDEVTANIGEWNGQPVTANHPMDVAGDGSKTAVSAKLSATIKQRYHIGQTYNDRITNGQRRVDVHIDVGAANRIDARIVPALLRGDPINVSTGLFSNKRDADPKNNRWNGKTYTHTVYNIKADHVAVLMDEDGACSVRDGCGINVNAEQKSKMSESEKSVLFLYNRDWPKGKRDKAPKSTFAGPHESFPIETQTDVDAAAKLIGHADNPEAVKARIKEIAKRKGLKIPSSWLGDSKNHGPGDSTHNSFFGGSVMNKDETVNWLVTNCDCWKGQEATLNGLDEAILGKIKVNAEKASKLDLTVNTLKEVAVKFGKPDATLTELQTLVRNAKSMGGKDANVEKEPPMKQKTRKSSGSQEGGDRRAPKKKDGYEGEYDDDSDEEEDRDAGGEGKEKLTKNKKAGMPNSASKGTDTDSNDELDNEDDGHGRGVETDEDQPMGGDEDPDGNPGKMAKGKGKKMSSEKMTENAVKAYFKGLTDEEFIALAPAGVRQTLNSAQEVVDKERIEIIKTLTANIKSDKQRKAEVLALKDKKLPDLRELLKYATLNSAAPVERVTRGRTDDEFLANFFGGGAGDVNAPDTNARPVGVPLYPNLNPHDFDAA
jgi:hypothetical protein